VGYEVIEDLESGSGSYDWSIVRLRTFSPFLFLLTTTIVLFYDAFKARKDGGYTGSLFTHTFESTLEDAIYMAIMTILVYNSLLTSSMYISWLAGPIAWVLFVFIFPLVRRQTNDDEFKMPWFLLMVLLAGVVVELITREWVALPLSWLIICLFKFVGTIREKNITLDTIFNMIYYAFSVVLMTLGIILNYWLTSWTAFPIALLICWILSKFKRFKKVEEETENSDVTNKS